VIAFFSAAMPLAVLASAPEAPSALETFLTNAADIAWGLPFILMLAGVGLYFTIRLGFTQFRKMGHAIAIGRGKYDEPDAPGEVTHFQALCAALSATVGVGNIGGVATAIWWGGPGAAIWMALFGLLGMMTKFASCTLAIKYRVTDQDGHIIGGPMEFLSRGLGKRFAWLATMFAGCAVIASFGGGNMVQANQMAGAFTHEFGSSLPPSMTEPFALFGEMQTNSLRIILGLVVAILVGLVIIGGIKRIGRVAGVLVPVMAVFYVGGALTVIILHIGEVPETLGTMFSLAFGGDLTRKAAGGAVGLTVLQALTWGAKRAVFSNEAGLGSAPIAHAAAKTNEPVREGLIAMLGPFIDTVVICMMTALVICLTGVWETFADGSQGAVMTKLAFEQGLPEGYGWIGRYTVAIGLILFAISTAISWSYYGDRCVTYLFGPKAVKPYRLVYVLVLFLGANIDGGMVWKFADVTNAAMAFWNIIGLLGLSTVVVALYKDYFSRPQEPLQ
jgi:AGCS family alanine or glycine:cation symporter